MVTKVWINSGSGNGLLPDDTKPLPEPMLTNRQLSLVVYIWVRPAVVVQNFISNSQ